MRFDIPDTTTTNFEEFKPERLTLPFAPELIEFILQDKKMTTYRFGLKYDAIQIGNTVDIQNSETKAVVAHAHITDKRQSTFADLPITNGTHESYEDKEHQRKVLSGYYAYIGRAITDDDVFLVFDFKLIQT